MSTNVDRIFGLDPPPANGNANTHRILETDIRNISTSSTPAPTSGPNPSSLSKPLDLPLNEKIPHLLLCATGSVATIKIPQILTALSAHDLSIIILLTPSSRHFLAGQSGEQPELSSLLNYPNVQGMYFDEDEWSEPWVRGNKILHIELRRWSDVMLIAPLSADMMAKIVGGWADGLITSVVRAWDTRGTIDMVREEVVPVWRPTPRERRASGEGEVEEWRSNPKKHIIVAPSMNTAMWQQPVTRQQITVLDEEWGIRNGGWFEVLLPMEKKELACGDVGGGAMRDWREIVGVIEERLGLGNKGEEQKTRYG